jgi:cadmium resistance protein CadD (predicted permease)
MITVESRGASAINIVGFSEPSLLNVTAITLGGTRDAKGMYLENVTGLKMNNVHISVSGGTYSNVGISYFLAGGQLIIENVSVLASGGQIAEAVVGFRGGDMAGSLIIRNATLEAKDASNYSIILDSGTHDEVSLVNVSASAQGGPNTIGIFGTYYTTQNIINSSLKSSGYLIQNPKNINIVNSQLDGGPIVPIGPNTVKCIGVYDGNYNPYTCPQ